MNYLRQHLAKTKLVALTFLCLALLISVVEVSKASVGTINKADLSGPWQMTLFGNTGCGLESMLVTFTLNGSGVANNASETIHVVNGSPCTDGSVTTGNNFTITSLSSNGSGTAGLTCGTGCGWTFHIQVAADRSEFNVVDVEPTNPNNLLHGVAVHQ